MNIAEIITENIPKVEDIKILSPEELKKQDIYKKVQELEEYKYKSEVIDIYLKDVKERINNINEHKTTLQYFIDYINNDLKPLFFEYMKIEDNPYDEEKVKLSNKIGFERMTKDERKIYFNKNVLEKFEELFPDEIKNIEEIEQMKKSNDKKYKKLLLTLSLYFEKERGVLKMTDSTETADGFFYNYIYGGYEEDLNILEGKTEELKKIKKDIPKLKNKLIVELEKKVISTKMAYIRAIIEYVKSSQFRAEIVMPLIILVVGLLGTDFVADILKMMGLKRDDAKELARVLKEIETELDKKKDTEKTTDNQNKEEEMKKIKASRVL